jgi:hypothetical protein
MVCHIEKSEIRDRAEEKHRDTHAERDFMAEGQRSKTELRRRSTGTHKLEGISWQKVIDQRQSCEEAQGRTC